VTAMNFGLYSRATFQLAPDASNKVPGAISKSHDSIKARNSDVKSNQQEISRFSSHFCHEIVQREIDRAHARLSHRRETNQAEAARQHKHQLANARNTQETQYNKASAKQQDFSASQSNGLAESVNADRSNPVAASKPASLVSSASVKAAELNHASSLKKTASNVDKESSKRLFLDNIHQLQLHQGKLPQAARGGLSGLQSSAQRQLAENYYHAMVAASRTQNLASASRVQDGSSTYHVGAKELAGTSVNLTSATISDPAGASAIPPIKTDSLSDAGLASVKLNAPMHERLDQAQWQQDLSQRIHIMLNHQIREARIQLHPKHLGAMEISVSLGHEQQVSVSFHVQHAHVKDALDAALPKLREMLQSQGFSLDHSDVSQQQDSSDQGGQTLPSPRSYYSPSFEQQQQDAQVLHAISISAEASSGLDVFA